jgi:multiple sugar transport system permease protein
MFTIVFIGPIYFLFTDGFKSTQEVIQTPPTFFPQAFHASVYQQAWNELNLGRLLFNTLYYAFGALLFQLVFDVAAAYAFSKLRPRFGNVILGMMLASLMIPAAVLLVPQYVTATDLPLVHMSLINTPEAIWLPSVASAFNIFLLKRFFDSIPDEIMQAAAIDGAGAVRTLRSVVLPMSRPILGVVSIFAMVTVWKDFLWPLLVEPLPTNQTLNAGISSLSQGVPQNVLIAASAIAAVPTIVLFLLFQRNIVSGLTAGGLKG